MTPAFATWYWKSTVCATDTAGRSSAAVTPLLAEVGDIQRSNRGARVVRQLDAPIDRPCAAGADRTQRAIGNGVCSCHAEAIEGSGVRRPGARVVGRTRRIPTGNRRIVSPRNVGSGRGERIEGFRERHAQRCDAASRWSGQMTAGRCLIGPHATQITASAINEASGRMRVASWRVKFDIRSRQCTQGMRQPGKFLKLNLPRCLSLGAKAVHRIDGRRTTCRNERRRCGNRQKHAATAASVAGARLVENSRSIMRPTCFRPEARPAGSDPLPRR